MGGGGVAPAPTGFKLNSGAVMPAVGLGVYLSPAGEVTYSAVSSGIALGYRHIDTAQYYQNEESVGQAVRDSGVPRADIWVTTKVWLSNWGYQKTLDSVVASLQRLGLDYVDLMLLHAPGEPSTREETWRALEDAQSQGLCKNIGVSNFGVGHLEKLLKTARVVPAVNQIELHPFLQWRDVVSYCQSKGILLQAYSPLSKARQLSHPTVTSVAQHYNVTPAQVMVRWSLQRGFVPLPKSVNPERQATNLDVFGFQINDEDMAALDALDEGLVTGWDPITNDPV